MKVLYLANIPSPYRVHFFGQLAKDCDLTVLFERKKAADRKANWQADAQSTYTTYYLNGFNIKKETAFAPSILRHLKKRAYDIIVIGGYATPTAMLAILWLKLKKIPFVLNADGGFIKKDGGLKEKVKRYFISSASAWLCSGNATRDYFVHYGADEKRVYTYLFTSLFKKDILTAAPTKNQKQAIRKTLKIPEQKMVLAVGQFIHRKGFDILLNAWNDMPKDYGLYLVGDDPTLEYLQMAKSLRLKNVHFVGFLTKANLAKYYTAADVFVLPTREDIWGLVVNEAMAYGLPVVTTTACNAGLALVDKTNGVLTPVDDICATRQAIIALLSDEKKLATFSKNALAAVKPYTIENMAEHHISIFKAVLKQ